MSRFVVRFQGDSRAFRDAASLVEKMKGVQVVDRSPSMLLIDAKSAVADQIAKRPEWLVVPETFTPLPDTKKRAKK
jgi:hypothetical protein